MKEEGLYLPEIEKSVAKMTNAAMASMKKTERFCSVFRPMAVYGLIPLMPNRSFSSTNHIVEGIKKFAPLKKEEAKRLRESAERLCKDREGNVYVINKTIILNAIEQYS